MVSVASLKQVKNTVIGNQSAKRQIAQDDPFVRMLVESLNGPSQTPNDDVRIEAAHIISSLSYGSPQALSTLLRAGAHQAILYAISRFELANPVLLRAAFARSLRTLTVSMAELVGPPQWGLTPDYSKLSVRDEAKRALDLMFQTDSLDIYLPLLSASSAASITTSIARLVASGVRIDSHRTAITEWLPPSERIKDNRANGSRRWEKASTTNFNSPAKYGGWIVMVLTGLIQSRDIKLQEAALYALATLAKDNIAVAVSLTKHSPDRDTPSVLSTILHLSKSKPTEIKLAACLCATQICRASSPPSPVLSTDLHDSCEHTIMHILGRMLNVQADEYSTHHRTRACYIFYHLVYDDQSLCLAAYERGCLESLAALIREITPLEAAEEWGEDEAESLSSLREAALILMAALSLLSPDIRRSVADELNLLPFAKSSLRHKHYGVRYAACQCIRALSRSVQALRTNLVDSGVGMAVLKIVMQGLVVNGAVKVAREGEIESDRRVLSVALSIVCNCVNDFSPLRNVYLTNGLLTRLVQMIEMDDDLRRDALWVIKNLLVKTSFDEKREVMNTLGWGRLVELLDHPDTRIQEQAFNIIRNLSENEEGIGLIFEEIGTDVLLDHIRAALESTDDDVTQQAALALANLVNGSETSYTTRITTVPRMLPILHTCLSDRRPDIRRPVCSIVYELARIGGTESRRALIDEGFGSTLRRIVEWAGSLGSGTSGTSGTLYVGSPTGMSTSPVQQQTPSGSHGVAGLRLPGHEYGLSLGREFGHRLSSPHRHHHRVEEDKKLTDLAKLALDWLEHGDTYNGYI
ncbi:hypothetical protein AX15_000830 [Amanita polypyramis BW_CC]|nr:hypothetical protein AX15_000830 [Amanita polypyramis BW_CC]